MFINITCPSCSKVFNRIKKFLTTSKYFFHKDFIKERYYLHFFTTPFAQAPITFVIYNYTNITETNIFFQIFINCLIGFFGNLFREIYLTDDEKGVKYSSEDVNFGAYSGIITTLISNIIWGVTIE